MPIPKKKVAAEAPIEIKASLGFKPLVAESNKFKPLKQIYSGYEIEKRWVIRTIETDYTTVKNSLHLYNEVLEKGTLVYQGYIKDIQVAKKMLREMGIIPAFKPNTIRLRRWGNKYILTLKDRKQVKKREVEWELDKKMFYKYWPLTKGARVKKVRYIKVQKGLEVTHDAFIDRFLLIIEIEVKTKEALDKLPTMGMDVTGISSWANKNLAK